MSEIDSKQHEMWWPSPKALDDLHVEVIEHDDGSAEMQLSAPDGSDCAAWLAYFQETEERQVAFERALIRSLLDQIEMKRNEEVTELK